MQGLGWRAQRTQRKRRAGTSWWIEQRMDLLKRMALKVVDFICSGSSESLAVGKLGNRFLLLGVDCSHRSRWNYLGNWSRWCKLEMQKVLTPGNPLRNGFSWIDEHGYFLKKGEVQVSQSPFRFPDDLGSCALSPCFRVHWSRIFWAGRTRGKFNVSVNADHNHSCVPSKSEWL